MDSWTRRIAGTSKCTVYQTTEAREPALYNACVKCCHSCKACKLPIAHFNNIHQILVKVYIFLQFGDILNCFITRSWITTFPNYFTANLLSTTEHVPDSPQFSTQSFPKSYPILLVFTLTIKALHFLQSRNIRQ